MEKFHVLIPAAGHGSRMHAELPKQYLPLLGRPLIAHTLAVFSQSPRISSISVVLSKTDETWDKFAIPIGTKVSLHRCGGDSRAQTVLNGLLAIQNEVAESDWMLVHDAARPGLSHHLLDDLLDSLQYDEVGGLLALPLADTLKRANDQQRVVCTESRDQLWQAQTPQMFRYGLLKRALENAGPMVTDEASAVEALGLQPRLVAGEWRNLKITYAQDLPLVEAIMAAESERRKS